MRMRRSSVVLSLTLLFLVLGGVKLGKSAPNAYCWGENANMGLATNDTNNKDVPTQGLGLVGLGSLSSISAGYVSCWGKGAASSRPFTTVSCGESVTCAIDTINSFGQLGVGTGFTQSATERNVTTLSGVTFVSAGYLYTCAVAGGVAYCWGLNAQGQLGIGNLNNASLPAPVALPTNVTVSVIATGLDHACALTTGYDLYCWGNNIRGALGVGTTATGSVSSPQKVDGSYIAVAAGQEVTCAVSLPARDVYCWGYAQNGILGDGSISGNQSTPVKVAALAGQYVAVAAGYTAAFAVGTDGQTMSWGRANSGQLGRGSLAAGSIHTPAPVSGGTTFGAGLSIESFGSFACALATAVPSATPSPTPSRSPTRSPSPSSSPTRSPSPSSSLTPSPSPTQSPSPSPSAVPVPSALVQADFDLNVPTVAISQSGGESRPTAQRINLNLVSLEETTPDGSTVLQTVDLQTVGWTVEEKNSSMSGEGVTQYVFTSQLSTATGGTNNATLQYLFNTYDSEQLITTGSNYSFTVTPSLLKFSLNISSWRWNSTLGKLRLTLKIVPSFARFTRWDDAPQAGMTTFLFVSAQAEQASTLMRLLNFGEASGGAGGEVSRVAMAASAQVNTSSLSLTFDHFTDTMLFDPDIGLLLGRKEDGSGSGGGDNLGLIIGVSVAVPVAVVFVVVAIVVALVIIRIKLKAGLHTSSGVVSFHNDNADDLL
ncbi:regulator of chromosome condensation (RCC1) repeat domain containing protein [Acanthamoeba castellanii str. Neff]|uniref:Regulator of chromosome condensation (RCC1) repeat domain containing protein n=1 Tax=Acanthamoeba castellanii (strain ATCC 30010 / Neff) TaxID=1257118 RepID=L8HF27_ACACF|nr:regulator of chromosome condensation (RCC1) repeat domain containing protein [Acanthamoeba castellanii str. Neff]ELR23373.1 regulator of chromosome condensation (RCC1) repeat domain containing protein [Acanthamoeba castellanii str. Neff]